jgi:formylglycine-generating enzyme required for sulfatase activity
VTLSDFVLDKYEVTVSRFRKFVEAFDGTPPVAGAGAHPLIAGTGWQVAWPLAASQADLKAALKCDSLFQTWTDVATDSEPKALNCVNWYEAFAFCAWDGGRLPTEAEWEYAAAGGAEDRLYPWGITAPACALANFDGKSCAPYAVEPVGTHPTGAGRWGHQDLAGNLWEWVFDTHDWGWYAGGGATCSNCANTAGPNRVSRGGYFGNTAANLRAADRGVGSPTPHGHGIGFRCARTP